MIMLRLKLNFIIIFVFLLISCKNENASTIKDNKPLPAEPLSTLVRPEIPGVPQEIMIRLLKECTFIDYIFHDYTFSVSQAEDSDIDQNISFIDINRPVGRLILGCKPMARKFFQIKGKIEYDVDVYLSDKCRYYVFVDKKSKPVYANYMTDSGIQFYTNIIQQATGAMQKQQ